MFARSACSVVVAPGKSCNGPAVSHFTKTLRTCLRIWLVLSGPNAQNKYYRREFERTHIRMLNVGFAVRSEADMRIEDSRSTFHFARTLPEEKMHKYESVHIFTNESSQFTRKYSVQPLSYKLY